jgi:hypothetical protein
VADSYEHGNEPLGSINGGGSLNWIMGGCQLLKKDSALWTHLVSYGRD